MPSPPRRVFHSIHYVMVISPVDLHRRHIVSFPEGAFTAASGKEIHQNVLSPHPVYIQRKVFQDRISRFFFKIVPDNTSQLPSRCSLSITPRCVPALPDNPVIGYICNKNGFERTFLYKSFSHAFSVPPYRLRFLSRHPYLYAKIPKKRCRN